MLAEETLDELGKGRKLIQKKRGFRFGIDSVILSHFVENEKLGKTIDIGTGTGIIPVLISSYTNEITACEIQPEAAHLCRRNIILNNLEDKVEVIEKNIKEIKNGNIYDSVISNPPYMKLGTGKINENDVKALSRHEINLSLDELISSSKRLLKPIGTLYLVYRTERLQELLELLSRYKFSVETLRFIHTKKGEPSKLFLIKAFKGKKGKSQVVEPLYIEDRKGNYSQEVKEYFEEE